MTLKDYLAAQGLTQSAFGARIGALQAEVARYVAHERMPRRETMRRIHEATGGEVTANDFYGLPLIEASSDAA